MSVKKTDLQTKRYILMYSVLGHPYMIFEAFETRSGAIEYVKRQELLSTFTILDVFHMVDVIKHKEELGWT